MFNSKAQDGEKEKQKTKEKYKKDRALWLQTLITRKHVVKFEKFPIKYITDNFLKFLSLLKNSATPFSIDSFTNFDLEDDHSVQWLLISILRNVCSLI